MKTNDSPDYNFGTGDFTFEGWFMWTGTIPVVSALMGNANTAFTAGIYIAYHSGSGGINIYIAQGTANKTFTWSGPASNTWYHIALVKISLSAILTLIP